MSSNETKLNLKFVSYPNIFEPSEKTAATELAKITSIEAPLDLEPKTAEIWLTLPDGMNATGGTIEINPEQSVEEITRLNNTVKL